MSLTLLLRGKGYSECEPVMHQLIIVRCIACKTCKRDVLHDFCPSVCLSVRHTCDHLLTCFRVKWFYDPVIIIIIIIIIIKRKG